MSQRPQPADHRRYSITELLSNTTSEDCITIAKVVRERFNHSTSPHTRRTAWKSIVEPNRCVVGNILSYAATSARKKPMNANRHTVLTTIGVVLTAGCGLQLGSVISSDSERFMQMFTQACLAGFAGGILMTAKTFNSPMRQQLDDLKTELKELSNRISGSQS